ISVSTLSFSYPWKKWTRGVSSYGTGLAESWGRLRLRDTAPPSPPYAYVAYERKPPRRRRPSRIQEHGNKVKEHRLEHARPQRATHSNYETKSFIFIGCDYKARL